MSLSLDYIAIVAANFSLFPYKFQWIKIATLPFGKKVRQWCDDLAHRPQVMVQIRLLDCYLRSVFRCKPCFLLATTYLGCHKNGKSLSNKCSTPFFLRGSSHAFTFDYLSWLMPSCPWFRRPARRTLCLSVFTYKFLRTRQYNRYMNKLHQAWGSDQL